MSSTSRKFAILRQQPSDTIQAAATFSPSKRLIFAGRRSAQRWMGTALRRRPFARAHSRIDRGFRVVHSFRHAARRRGAGSVDGARAIDRPQEQRPAFHGAVRSVLNENRACRRGDYQCLCGRNGDDDARTLSAARTRSDRRGACGAPFACDGRRRGVAATACLKDSFRSRPSSSRRRSCEPRTLDQVMRANDAISHIPGLTFADRRRLSAIRRFVRHAVQSMRRCNVSSPASQRGAGRANCRSLRRDRRNRRQGTRACGEPNASSPCACIRRNATPLGSLEVETHVDDRLTPPAMSSWSCAAGRSTSVAHWFGSSAGCKRDHGRVAAALLGDCAFGRAVDAAACRSTANRPLEGRRVSGCIAIAAAERSRADASHRYAVLDRLRTFDAFIDLRPARGGDLRRAGFR